jgi:preprotein translocase subunit SecG
MNILMILFLVIIIFLIYKNNKEQFSQDFYPHQYNSNEIPCLPKIIK